MTDEEFKNKQVTNPQPALAPTLRDMFAGAAITGILASSKLAHDDPKVAHLAYKVADAMIEERK